MFFSFVDTQWQLSIQLDLAVQGFKFLRSGLLTKLASIIVMLYILKKLRNESKHKPQTFCIKTLDNDNFSFNGTFKSIPQHT